MSRAAHPLIDTYAKRGAGLTPLRPLLRSWTECTIDYCKCHGWIDNSWWYNERASLSILAGAAWRIPGWAALEEYSTSKRAKVPETKVQSGDVTSGRCDLWVGKDTGIALEAKQAWQSIGNQAKGANPNIKQARALAWADAGRISADEADLRVAVVFVSPYIPLREVQRGQKFDQGLVRECVAEWLASLNLKSDPDVHAYAYCFPCRDAEFTSKNGKYVFPGTLILMRLRERAGRRSAKAVGIDSRASTSYARQSAETTQ